MLRALSSSRLGLVALLVSLLLVADTHAAQGSEVDPAEYLPSGTSVLQSVSGDVDGDGRDDLVVLYAIQSSFSAQSRAGLLILLHDDDLSGARRAVHLFGAPPADMRGEPALDPHGRAELTLSDLTGDGVAEILLAVTVQYQEPIPRTLLWVFGRGDVPADHDDPGGPLPPPWAGTGFRAEAFLEGNTVAVLPPDPTDAAGASALERETVGQRFGGPDPGVAVSERFAWRDGGFRLIERSLSLPPATTEVARSPETAVLAFYEATGRGEIQAAVDLLGDELRASRSSTLMHDPSAPARAQRVEEVRTLDGYSSRRARSETERLVYVRVSAFDETPPAQTAPAGAITQATPRSTIAGTWKTQKIGDRWRLVAADLHQTANLDTISAVLPSGVTVVETAGGDLRRQGVEDLAVLVTGPGRFSLVEPYVVFGGPSGPERGLPLGSFVEGGSVGAVGATVRIDDVNADGQQEIAYSAFVGAHSALLWILGWDGSTLVPLFAEASNSPVVDLDDLDGDGVSEIVLGQSGYCGSYAASPHLMFAFRWEDGEYRPASMHYPALYDGIDGRAAELTIGPPDSGQSDAAACVQHMLALANAFRGRPAEMLAAYRAYAQARRQAGDGAGLFVRPIYLGAAYVEADLRAVLAAAESGQSPGWGPSELAILHDLLGDALIERARAYQFEAESAGQRGDADAAREARRKASEARQAATREYQAALDLDPTDEEARRNLGE